MMRRAAMLVRCVEADRTREARREALTKTKRVRRLSKSVVFARQDVIVRKLTFTLGEERAHGMPQEKNDRAVAITGRENIGKMTRLRTCTTGTVHKASRSFVLYKCDPVGCGTNDIANFATMEI